jgi:hypothetical protein
MSILLSRISIVKMLALNAEFFIKNIESKLFVEKIV